MFAIITAKPVGERPASDIQTKLIKGNTALKRIRLFATVLAAGLTASLSAQQATDIIVESYPDGKNATGFSKVDGNWNESVNKSTAEGLTASKSIYKTLELPGSVLFKADVPEDGKYDVFITYPSSGNASGVIYTITHTGGNTTVIQDQFGTGNDPATSPNTWIPLGTYEFKKDTPATVEIRDPNTKQAPDPNEPNQRIYADAIKLVPNGGTPMVAAVSMVKGGTAAPSVVATMPGSPAVVPGAPAIVAVTTVTAEGLPGLSAAAPAQNLPGLSAASADTNLPALSAVSPTQSLPGLSAASPGQNLPGLSAAAGATTPTTTAAPAVAEASTPAAPTTALPGLSAATTVPPSELPSLTAVATPAPIPSLTALPDAASTATAIAALPATATPAAMPGSETPALPLLNAPAPPTMVADTPAVTPPLLAAAVTPAPTPDVSAAPIPTPTMGVPGAADIAWSYDIGAAQTVAEKGDQKIFIFLTAPNNRMGIKYETEYFTQPAVRAQIDRFVPLRLNFPTNSHYAYKLGAMGAGKIVVIDRAENVLLNIDQIPASPDELAKLLENVK